MGVPIERERDGRSVPGKRAGEKYDCDCDEGVDAKLTDDIIRAVWRSRWHERLAEIGAEDAANPAREAGEFFSPEELRQRTSAASTSV
ncbi:MAG: hypothetical protein JRN42_06565 [Nitrososphaerota archaeon]|nr:hypothetical protein [Nitrososphaerota archaeon]